MTAAPSEASAPAAACPRCGAALAAGQDWCLECGAAATTRILPTPGWRLPAAILATAMVLAGAGAAVAYVQLSDDEEPQPARTVTTAPGAAVQTAPPAAPPAQTTPPAATQTVPPAGTETAPPAGTDATPPAGTTSPGQTAPAPSIVPGPGTPPPGD